MFIDKIFYISKMIFESFICKHVHIKQLFVLKEKHINVQDDKKNHKAGECTIKQSIKIKKFGL